MTFFPNPTAYSDGANQTTIADNAAHQLIAAQPAQIRTYIGSIVVTNGSSTVGTFVNLLDGATIRWTVFAGINGGGASQTLDFPLRGSPATAWSMQCETNGAAVRVSISGYTSEL